MCKEAVKISAAVPTSWKVNRRLFRLAMMPYLKKSKWLLHADGRLPYFSWWVNMPLQFGVWLYRHVAKRVGLIKGNQGPWGDWVSNVRSPEWMQMVEQSSEPSIPVHFLKEGVSVDKALLDSELRMVSRINLMQSVYPR